MSELTMLHVGSGSIGYGRYGVELHKQLLRMGVDVYDHIDDPEFNPAAVPPVDHMNTGRKSKLTNVVGWVSVPTHARGWFKGQYSFISSMWEATRLPESFRESMHNFNKVIVPSEQNLELFSRYHDNVSLVPLGVDPEVWGYKKRTPPGAEFRFLIGGSGPRKGTDLAYRAFNRVFKTWPKDGPVPKLIMKSPRSEDFYGERIERIGGRIEPQAEVDLYASAHCYIQPSRGEGFGLQPLQAIAQGMPTILTNAHGHAGFAHLGYGLDYKMEQSSYFVYGEAGDWWEPDFDHLCDYMLWVYENYDAACETAKVASDEALSTFTWAETARQFVEALEGEIDQPYTGNGEWFTPDIKRYKLVTNRDFAADIAGVNYQWRKGVEYLELADCKRILFEAGILDPVCCEGEDNGLTESQMEHLRDYSGAHSFCRECGHRLNDGASRTDELMADIPA